MIAIRRWQMTLVVLLALSASTLVVHGPALTAAPQFDVVQYWSERHEWPSLSQAIERLDFPRARRYWKGDEAEFRPLVFLLLALEYDRFGLDIRLWHALQFLMHVVVGWLLWRLLVRTQPPAAALLLAILFTVLTTTVHLVTDTYLGGYLIACGLLLVAVDNAWNTADRIRGRAAAWFAYAAAMTIASFYFEVMAVMSLAAAPALFLEARRRGRTSPWLPVALAAPFVVFSAVYLFRMPALPRFAFLDDAADSSFLAGSIWTLPARSASLLSYMTSRTMIPALRSFWQIPAAGGAEGLWPIALALNVAALAAAVTILGLGRRAWTADVWRLLPLLSMLAAFVVFIRFGRGVEDGNHLYVFSLLFVLAASAAFDLSRLGRGLQRATVCVLAAFIALNATLASNWTWPEGKSGEGLARYLSAMNAFVRAHRDEPGFSFAVVTPPFEASESITLLEGYPDVPVRVSQVPPTTALFGGTTADRARYLLRWNGEAIAIDRP